MNRLSKSIAILCCMLVTQSALADDSQLIDSASAEFAYGARIQMVRLGVQSDWSERWFESNGTHLSGYWDLNAGLWDGNDYRGINGDNQNLTDVGIDPTFRFENDNKKGFYFEGAIGAHRLSKFYNNAHYRLSTLFEFSDHIGIGYVFKNNWELGVKLVHFSNGGYSEPNSGVDLLDFKASYHF